MTATAIPAAARAVVLAALDDYWLTVPPAYATAAEAARRVAEYLISSGYTARRPGILRPNWRRKEFPCAAAHEIRNALVLYHLLADPQQVSTAAQAERIVIDLTEAGWLIVPNTRTRSAA
ncbi:hypothetical protein [Streptomyces sp. NRRL S-1813]|uniref:hypothetical protein n=1 Tax=Streptomyces sp. NRRL S-1813 TaxID=1463888 RepID=UPI0004C573F0|nr:hypothetical protein [Streptomyces sp. NRRL S-1813]